jgi:large subunit ribosomal protein L10
MDRTQKAEAVQGLNGLFADAGAVIVAHYSGMTVAQMGEMRARLGKAGASFKVAKNRLAMRALEGTPAAGISDLFKGPTGIAYSKDPVSAAKVLVAYAKENDKLKILGGVAVGSVLNPEGVKALAELPSLDQLRGKILGLLQAPATKIAGVLQAPAGSVARVIAAYAEKEAA